MEYLWLFFYYVDIYVAVYFVAGIFMDKLITQSMTTNFIALLIYFIISVKKDYSKNPYLKIKRKLGKVLAVIINIILIVFCIKSIYR